MNNTEVDKRVQWDAGHIIHAIIPIGKHSGMIIESAEGVIFRDLQGKEYLDGSSQLTCVNLGYGQQEIMEAAFEQMKRLPYCTTFYGQGNQPLIECAQKLSELTPGDLDFFHFTSGGSESTETAYRLARLYWNAQGSAKFKIISLWDSYHGINMGSLSADGLGRGFFSRGAGPLNSGFLHIPSYNCYHCMLGLKYPQCEIGCARFLEETIVKEGADTVAAFIAEPEQGTAGGFPPPAEYWPRVREICSKYDVLLIADEVMTGFGRTGKMFAVEHWNVVPDLMAVAKGITSAYLPMGAVAMRSKVFEGLKGQIFASYTYSGHPVCAAAAVKAMEIYTRDKIVENAARMGAYALKRMRSEILPLPHIGDISGLGLMIGIEIVADKNTHRPFAPELNILQKVQKQALEAGLFMRAASSRMAPGDRLSFSPPLTVKQADIDRMIDILMPILSRINPDK